MPRNDRMAPGSGDASAKRRLSIARGQALFAVAACALLAALFCSCATARTRLERDPLASLGSDAALYLVVPVRANEDAVRLFSQAVAQGGTPDRVIKRAEALYLAISPGGSRPTRFIASGSFPKSAASLAFSKSSGWERIDAPGGSWYRNGALDAAIPARGVLCGIARPSPGVGGEGDGEMPDLLSRVGKRAVAVTSVTPAFARYASFAQADGRIGFFIVDPAPVAAIVLGPDVAIPASFAEGYAERDESGGYGISVRVSCPDGRSAKAMRSILSIAFRGAVVSVDGDAVAITGIRVPREKLADLGDFLYLGGK